MMLLVYAAGLAFWRSASCHHSLLGLSRTYKSGLL